MEHSWENLTLIHTDADFLEHCHTDDDDDDDFLRDILQQPEFSSQSDDTQSCHHHHHHPAPPPIVHNNNSTASLAATDGSISSISSDGTHRPAAGRSKPHHRPSSSNSPRTFILSFDNSTIIPATPEQPYLALGGTTTPSSKPKSTSSNALSSKKRALDDTSNSNTTNNHQNLEAKPSSRATSQGGKKSRNDSQTMDHIMAERKRRQELSERFIALSATIPGLKKTDKASILGEAIKYVKQLKERVTELEKRNKQMILVKKSDGIIELVAKEDGGMMMISSSSETSSGGESAQPPRLIPDVEARVVEKEVLVEIHCQKANGIELKLMEHLENLHLTVTGSSVLPFANSTLGITIIAEMGEGYRMTVNDVVTNLREVLLKNEAATATTTTTTTSSY